MTSVWDKAPRAKFISVREVAIDLQITVEEVMGRAGLEHGSDHIISMATAREIVADKYQEVVGKAFEDEIKKESTMEWKNITAFDSGHTEVLIQEIYKGHEITVATDHNGSAPGIKVWKAVDGKLTKTGSNPPDLTDCFNGVDAAHEIPFSMAALRDIFNQIDAKEMNERIQNHGKNATYWALKEVMLVRCMQGLIERTMKEGKIDVFLGKAMAMYVEKWLYKRGV